MRKLLGTAGAIVVIGIGSFYAGSSYGKSHVSVLGSDNAASGQQVAGARGAFRGGGRNRGGGFAAGDIIAKDATSVTVKMRTASTTDEQGALGGAGGSKIVFFSSTTDIGKAAKASPDELVVGTRVIVNGTPNSNGSVTAQSIQIRSSVFQEAR